MFKFRVVFCFPDYASVGQKFIALLHGLLIVRMCVCSVCFCDAFTRLSN